MQKILMSPMELGKKKTANYESDKSSRGFALTALREESKIVTKHRTLRNSPG